MFDSKLEGLLLELDDQWSKRGACRFDTLIVKAQSLGMKAVVELCAADLEWRWRKLGFNKERPGNAVQIAARDYHPYLETWWNQTECQIAMLQAEWLARSAWGDRPRIDAFLQGKEHPPTARRDLLDYLNVAAKLELAVSNNQQTKLSLPMPSSFVIGRQRVGEPTPPLFIPASDRLIVWPVDEVQVSRDQLRIERVCAFELCVTNISTNCPVTIDGQVLDPKKSQHISLPFFFAVADMSVRVYAIDIS